MQIKTLMVFTQDEFIKHFDPRFIAETFMRGSKPTQTGRGKRLFKEMFSGKEDVVKEYITTAKKYYSSGVPQKLELTGEQYDMWRKLCRYCVEVA